MESRWAGAWCGGFAVEAGDSEANFLNQELGAGCLRRWRCGEDGPDERRVFVGVIGEVNVTAEGGPNPGRRFSRRPTGVRSFHCGTADLD